jgi:hypothetical protein
VIIFWVIRVFMDFWISRVIIIKRTTRVCEGYKVLRNEYNKGYYWFIMIIKRFWITTVTRIIRVVLAGGN